MATDLPKAYNPNECQPDITERWLEAKAYSATPDDRPRDQRYVIMMPLPNVTGALHMGHAMDNVMQDLLIRWHRMMGHNTLWQPGTDHAGIATQAVVEKRLFELEGKTRHDIGREALVERIYAWKDEYQSRIIRQQQAMGCSADWSRQRFTMDAVCSRTVREVFFRLFTDKLIYRGDRLVNWDCQLRTAVADDEVYHETTQGHFWHLKYPVIDPQAGEPAHVIVATTRPETMLGDTAVAVHPDPEVALDARIAAQQLKVQDATQKEKKEEEEKLAQLKERKKTHLASLIKLKEMAAAGRKVLLPLMKREIPLILDEWAKPELGSGCVKITPAHDPNDHDVWHRHRDRIDIINILNPDGTLNENAKQYAKCDRFDARDKVVADLKAQGLLDDLEDREVEIGYSDRSKTAIEPYLSKQWFVNMGDVEGGIVCGRGTDKEFEAEGLAQAAIDAVSDDWQSPTGLRLSFHPERYRGGYVAWLAEKRDWCISRQLWWGHRIPVWTKTCNTTEELEQLINALPASDDTLQLWIADSDGGQHEPKAALQKMKGGAPGPFEAEICIRNLDAQEKRAAEIEQLGFAQDPDVLDTWFSSALWPFSTLGWPDPMTAPVEAGQTALDGAYPYYYPGSCLVTARDIITLWVARMLMMGLYNLGDVPFTDCFVHANIQDGKGEKMSKTKGNGIDPVDIIGRYGADAMRYLVCDMETGMQDVRLPVQAICPSCEKQVELTDAKHGRTIFTYLCTKCKTEFDVLGTMKDVPTSQVFSDRFEVGKNFCNKLWNAARFAMMNLGDLSYQPLELAKLEPEDRWILSRLSNATREVTENLQGYRPSMALSTAREFFWGSFCDWYLELIKPRMRDPERAPVARQVLAVGLDQVLRLLHPFVPFITEMLWSNLGKQAPKRGIDQELPISSLCVEALWPTPNAAWADTQLETDFATLQNVIGRLRELRARHDVPPSKALPAAIKTAGGTLQSLLRYKHLITDMAHLSSLEVAKEIAPPKNAATHIAGDIEVFLADVLDPVKERERLQKQQQKLTKQKEGSEKKLANKNFVAKAPPEVVETERNRLEEMTGQLAIIEKNLAALED